MNLTAVNAVKGDTVTIKAGGANVKNITSPTLKTIYSNADDQEIGRFGIKADDVTDVKVKSIVLSATTSPAT